MGSWHESNEPEQEQDWKRPSASSYGLVTELVQRDEPTRAREGVIHMGSLATVCLVEQVPIVGDLIRGEVPGIVEMVKITRRGRVVIHARPLPAAVP